MANQSNNKCENSLWFVPNTLATAFVVPQRAGDTFEPMESLKKGTIYPELYKPYVARGQRK